MSSSTPRKRKPRASAALFGKADPLATPSQPPFPVASADATFGDFIVIRRSRRLSQP